MIINNKSLGDLQTSFHALFLQGMAQITPQYLEVAMEVPSTGAEEAYGWLKNLPRMREWLGDRVLNNLEMEDFRIKNKKFENTVTVKAEHIEDDKLGQYAKMFEMLGSESKSHPDELVFALLKAAFTTVCFDGQFFIDTDHPVIDENGAVQSVSNHGGGAGASWFLMDVSKPVKPIIFQRRRDYRFVALDKPTDQNAFMRDEFTYGVDCRVNAGFALWQLAYGSKQTLDDTNYELARANISGRLGDHGKPLRLQGNLLVVGPSNEAKAKKLVTAEKNAAGADNIHKGTAKVIVVPELG